MNKIQIIVNNGAGNGRKQKNIYRKMEYHIMHI